ncbi:hypothetical protein [Polyangium sp. 6x1]|uniref:hypothetical protein n=1 Tax=Polyangium sp. 6x1 TaxID=3042689 RepID=UPI0024828785|nr:hypothetical protein [Polyangium sp. 6x1]MDI1444654.1 hypothetical protein [Polyangium sp. 6x1]
MGAREIVTGTVVGAGRAVETARPGQRLTNAQASRVYRDQGAQHLITARQSVSVGDHRLASSYCRKAAEAFDIAATYAERESDAHAGKPSKGRPIRHTYELPRAAEEGR